MHDSSFKERHFVQSETLAKHAKDLLTYNTINRLNIILYYSQSLNTCEFLTSQIYQ